MLYYFAQFGRPVTLTRGSRVDAMSGSRTVHCAVGASVPEKPLPPGTSGLREWVPDASCSKFSKCRARTQDMCPPTRVHSAMRALASQIILCSGKLVWALCFREADPNASACTAAVRPRGAHASGSTFSTSCCSSSRCMLGGVFPLSGS